MRLLRLRFKNLNSLAGEWTIDFTDPGFHDGLFLITGPTGSGKTTVLDAVTLALYGRTAREKTISATQNEVMTRRTADCFAEVTFETTEGRFTARWSQYRARHKARGALQGIERSLFDANGRDISVHPSSRTGEKIERIVRLSFDQFTRTVLLAQGAFDAFLTADSQSRATLLEQATGTEIYSRIGRRIYEKSQSAKRESERLEAEVGAIVVLADDERAAVESEVRRLESLEKALAPRKDRLKRLSDWLEKGIVLERQRAEWTKQKNALGDRVAAFEPRAGLLAAAERALPLNGSAERCHAARRAARQASERVAARAREERRLAERLPGLQKTADESEAAATRAKDVFDNETGRVADARRLIAEVEKKHTAWTSAQREEKREKEWLDNLRQDLAGAENRAAEARNKRAKLESAADPFDESLRLAEDAQGRLSQTFRDAAQAAQTERTLFERDRDGLEKAVKAAEMADKFANRVHDLETERKHLVQGQPCPLCGAIFDGKPTGLPDADETGALLEQAREILAERTRRVDEAQKSAAAAEREFLAAEKKLAELKAAAEAARSQRRSEMASLDAVAIEQDNRAANLRSDIAIGEKKLADAVEKTRAAHEEFMAGVAERDALGIPDPDDYERQARAVFETAKNNALQARHNADDTREKLRDAQKEVVSAKDEADAADKERAKQETAFRQALLESGFTDEAAWRAALWNPGDIAAAHREREEIAKESTRTETLQKTWERDHAEHLASPDRTDRTREDVGEEYRAVSNELASAHDGANAKRNDLGHDDEARARRAETAQRLDEARRNDVRWGNLNTWLGGLTGDRFRRYAQEFTLRELVAHATPRLLAMSGGRYELFWDTANATVLGARASGNDLLPGLIDHEQDCEERPLSNLSGGERFQVSLALALGLSEMNAEGVSIESLFLDEGFGTLDGDALERAIDTLEAVQSTGCLLGIISHVEALAERLPVQLHVTRLGSGRSALSGIGVGRADESS